MKTAAIIAEFNPLHWGHHHIIQAAKKDGYTVIILLSGFFTQRGEPVVIDKFTRAKDALKAWADLVITHPVTSATSHGNEFSSGSIDFLMKLPNLQAIYCGGETSDLSLLKRAILIEENFEHHKSLFLRFLSSGESYTSSLRKTFESISPEFSYIFQPNMLLAFGYAKALNKYGKLHYLHLIPRINNRHNSSFLSASEIRKLDIINDKEFIYKTCFSSTPQYELELLMNRLFDIYRSYFLYNFTDFSKYDGYEIGIENRIIKSFKISRNMNEFLNNTATKRYSKVRIQRLLLHSFLEINKNIKTNSSRHTFNTIARNNLVNTYFLEKIQGHKSKGMTFNYTGKIDYSVQDAEHKKVLDLVFTDC